MRRAGCCQRPLIQTMILRTVLPPADTGGPEWSPAISKPNIINGIAVINNNFRGRRPQQFSGTLTVFQLCDTSATGRGRTSTSVGSGGTTRPRGQ